MRKNILPEFGEHSYIHEVGPKLELILFQIRDSITIFKKETNIFVEFFKLNVNNIDRSDIVVGGYLGQGIL